MVLGFTMLIPLSFGAWHSDASHESLIISAAITVGVGILLWWLTRNSSRQVGKREGFLIVSIGWISVSLLTALPYTFSSTLPSFTDAFFEAVSGLTTTGASVINDIEAVDRGILLWRSISQWIGGMGIIVLTVAIFPLLGIGGVELFVAEAPGPKSDKIHPRITEVAKRIWLIYCGLSFTLMIILWLAGMSFYDAINHGFTTMATGGFSTKNASIAHYPQPLIQYTITFFMFLAGINYTVIYFGLMGKLKKVWKSEEFRTYTKFIVLTIVLLTTALCFQKGGSIEQNFREISFQVVSIVTTTGFVSADYTVWAPAFTLVFFILLFMGGCAGSTSGGIKFIRHLVFFKNSYYEFRRLLHPRAVVRLKIDGKLVAPRILTHILVFLLIYLFLFVVGSVIMAMILHDFDQPFVTAIGAVATSLSNVGPAVGQVGPVHNFAEIPVMGKWFLVSYMLLGRLELFTILILFTPYFWKMH